MIESVSAKCKTIHIESEFYILLWDQSFSKHIMMLTARKELPNKVCGDYELKLSFTRHSEWFSQLYPGSCLTCYSVFDSMFSVLEIAAI